MKNKEYVKILGYFKKVKVWVAILAILMLILCGIGIVTPIINANLLTSLTELNVNNAFKYAILFLIFSLVSVGVTRLTYIVFLNKIKRNVVLNIRKDMISHIFKMKTLNFDLHTSGEFSERLKNDPEEISSILNVVQYSLFNMIADILILIYIVYLNWIMGLIYLFCIGIIYFYEKGAYKEYEKLNVIKRKLQDRNSTLLNEIMRGIRDIKLLNIAPQMYPIACDNLTESTDYDTKMSMKYGIIIDTVEVIKIITTIAIVILGIVLVSLNKLTVTNLLIIFMYRENIFSIITCYTSIKEHFSNFKVSATRIFEFADNRKFPKDKYGKKELVNVRGKIQCKNLTFAYLGKENVIDKLNLTIKSNDTIGIVGASGSEKTTLLNLINKSYYVKNNQLFIDDIEINNLSEETLRKNISIISQNPYIFNFSIRENLELVGTNVTEDEMIEACKVAQIHDFIMKLPNQYDTILGEGGTNLSGGQKQRLAIARALIKKSKIINVINLRYKSVYKNK